MGNSGSRVARIRRHIRVRKKIKGTTNRPRMCIFRSLNNIYAQIIDDTIGHTLTSASNLEDELKSEINGKVKTAQAEQVGILIAKRAKDKGISQIVFDRGGYKYHGRVKALADGARKGGLIF